MSRPSLYTPQLVEDICELLASGEPLAAICRRNGFPSAATVRNWMEERSDVSIAIARAREEGEDALAAQVLEIIDAEPARVATMHGDQIDSGDVSNRKMRAEYRLKLLAKWNPKRWGEKVEATVVDGNKLEVVRTIVNGPNTSTT